MGYRLHFEELLALNINGSVLGFKTIRSRGSRISRFTSSGPWPPSPPSDAEKEFFCGRNFVLFADTSHFVAGQFPFVAPRICVERILFRNHPALARIIEQAAGVHDGAHVAERFEFIFWAAVHE
jgi:hypothetical protein